MRRFGCLSALAVLAARGPVPPRNDQGQDHRGMTVDATSVVTLRGAKAVESESPA